MIWMNIFEVDVVGTIDLRQRGDVSHSVAQRQKLNEQKKEY